MIYLLHAPEDRFLAEEIARYLDNIGVSVRWNEAEHSYRDAAGNRYLAVANLVVLIWTRNSAGLDWVREDALEAFRTNRLACVVIDALADLPIPLRAMRSFILHREPAPEKLERLARALEDRANERQGNAIAAQASPPPSESSSTQPQSAAPGGAFSLAIPLLNMLVGAFVGSNLLRAISSVFSNAVGAAPDDEPVVGRPMALPPPSDAQDVQQATTKIRDGINFNLDQAEDSPNTRSTLTHFDIADPPSNLGDMRRTAATARSVEARPDGAFDNVDASAFASRAHHAGEQVLVQIYFHLKEDLGCAKEAAVMADPEAERRVTQTLDVPVRVGEAITVVLESKDLQIESLKQSVAWRRIPTACSFSVTMPSDKSWGSFPVLARVFVDGVPVGSLVFTLRLDKQNADDEPKMLQTAARRYSNVFLSYSSQDRPEVLRQAQLLSRVGISFFQDVLTLEPGARWENELYRRIDTCDAFLLFWSSNAAKSEWVLKEADYAAQCMDASKDGRPESCRSSWKDRRCRRRRPASNASISTTL